MVPDSIAVLVLLRVMRLTDWDEAPEVVLLSSCVDKRMVDLYTASATVPHHTLPEEGVGINLLP